MRTVGPEQLPDRRLHAQRVARLVVEQADQVEGDRLGGEHLLQRQAEAVAHPPFRAARNLREQRHDVGQLLLHAGGGRDAKTGASDVQRLQGVLLTAPFDADQAFARNPHVGKRDLVGRRATLPRLLFIFADQEALGQRVDHEAGDACGCAGVQRLDARDVTVGDPLLRAVQHVELVDLLAVAFADERHVVDVDAPVADDVVTVLLFPRLVGVFLRVHFGGCGVVPVAVEDLRVLVVELESPHVGDVATSLPSALVQEEMLDAVFVSEHAPRVEARLGTDTRRVRAGAGLGQREGGDHPRRDQPQEELVGKAPPRHLVQLGLCPFVPARQRGQRFLQTAEEAIEIALHAGDPRLLHRRQKLAKHNLLEDSAAAQLGADILVERGERGLEPLDVGVVAGGQQLFDLRLEPLDQLGAAQHHLQVALGRRHILVEPEDDRVGADTGVALDGECVAHVGQALRDHAEAVVIGLRAALAAVFRRDDDAEVALPLRPSDILPRDVMQPLDVAVVGWVVAPFDEAFAEKPQVLLVVGADDVIGPDQLG